MEEYWLRIWNFVLSNKKRQTSLILFQPIIATNYRTIFSIKNQLIMNIKRTMQCLTFAGVLSVSSLFAAEVKTDSVAPLSISGQVDAFFRSSSSNKLTDAKTSYTNQQGFGLGMANVAISKDNGKIGFVADLMFGMRAEGTNYNYSGSPAYLKQLFVTYKPVDKLKFTLGNFMTYVGYELIEASNNLNYSMSYNYTNGPFFHTGLKADIALTDKLGAMVGVFSQTDTKGKLGLLNPSLDSKKKMVGGQLGYVDGAFKIYLNGLGGKTPDSTSTTTLDLTTSFQATEKLGLGFNLLSYSQTKEKTTGSFLGAALYVNAALASNFVLALRGELFQDKDGLKYAATDNTITAVTLSGNIKIDGFTLIPEIRFDSAKKEIWADDKGAAKKGETSFILAAVYKF